MSVATHVLFESSSGYALFKAKLVEEIGAKVSYLSCIKPFLPEL